MDRSVLMSLIPMAGARGIGLGPADDQEGPNQHRVAGGYKATLSSAFNSLRSRSTIVLMESFLADPRTSDEAKAHAEEKLAELGEQ